MISSTNVSKPQSRSATGARPRRRVRFVFTAVSSINTSLCGSWRILGWRRVIQSRRARRSAGLSRSTAINPFLYDNPARPSARCCDDSWTCTPWVSHNAAVNSFSVMSGSARTMSTRKFRCGASLPNRPGGLPCRFGAVLPSTRCAAAKRTAVAELTPKHAPQHAQSVPAQHKRKGLCILFRGYYMLIGSFAVKSVHRGGWQGSVRLGVWEEYDV